MNTANNSVIKKVNTFLDRDILMDHIDHYLSLRISRSDKQENVLKIF